MRSRRIRFHIKREQILRLRRLSAASLRMTRFFYLPDKPKFEIPYSKKRNDVL